MCFGLLLVDSFVMKLDWRKDCIIKYVCGMIKLGWLDYKM